MPAREPILELIARSGADGVDFDKEARSFRNRNGGGRPAGLIPKLKRAFWPNYQCAGTTSHKRFRRKKKTDIRHPSEGMRRGSAVHDQLELLTNGGPGALRRKQEALHAYTRKAVAGMKVWKWRPRRAELTVFDRVLNIATRADMLATGAKGQLILLEFKTGYDNYFECGSGAMCGPLRQHISNSPKHQALLQLFFTRELIERNYGVRIDESYVVHIHCDGVTPHKLEGTFNDGRMRQRLWDHLEMVTNSARRTGGRTARKGAV